MNQRTIKDVIADWRASQVSGDYGELESRVNYFIATEIEPQLRNLTEAERQVVEAAVVWCKADGDFNAALDVDDAVARLEKVRGV
jgi:tellurite resistance protein